MRSLANFTGTVDGGNITALLQGSQGLLNAGTSVKTSEKRVDVISNGPEPSRPSASGSKVDNSVNFEDHLRSMRQCQTVPVSDMAQSRTPYDNNDAIGPGSTYPLYLREGLPAQSIIPETTLGRINFNNIDLNSVYDDSQDRIENLGNSYLPLSSGTMSLNNPLWIQHGSNKSSQPHPSGNSDSTSTQSPSSSSGEGQVSSSSCIYHIHLITAWSN